MLSRLVTRNSRRVGVVSPGTRTSPQVGRAFTSAQVNFAETERKSGTYTSPVVNTTGARVRTMASSAASAPGTPERVEQTKQALKKAQAICFDVDSTVLDGEGVDALAEMTGKGKEVAELTNSAMHGTMLFQDAIRKRLDIMQPTRGHLDDIIRNEKLHLTPGVVDFISALQNRGTKVYLVSGGFREMILPYATRLNIPEENVYANVIIFNEDGTYKTFDDTVYTSRSGGKAEVAKLLKEQHQYDPLIFIGDGVTDLEARPPADFFIGYGGIVEREKVREGADWFVHDFKDLTKEI